MALEDVKVRNQVRRGDGGIDGGARHMCSGATGLALSSGEAAPLEEPLPLSLKLTCSTLAHPSYSLNQTVRSGEGIIALNMSANRLVGVVIAERQPTRPGVLQGPASWGVQAKLQLAAQLQRSATRSDLMAGAPAPLPR